MNRISLRKMKKNQTARLMAVTGKGEQARRIMDMGLTPGVKITVLGKAPLKDPVNIKVNGFSMALRNNEADHIIVEATD